MAKKKVQTNDDKIQDLVKIVKKKKEEISKAEKSNWETNCSFRRIPSQPNSQNIQAVSDVSELIDILGFLIGRENEFNLATSALGLSEEKFEWQGFTREQWQSDIQTRITKIQLKKKKAELEILEKRLNSLISPELKANIELEEITQMLNK